MVEYRFSLQKYKRGSKLSCPNCGKKQCFVKYIDSQGKITFPDYVGRCDHEQSCQYHYTPSDYFHDNPMVVDYNKDNFIEADKPKPNLLPPTSFVALLKFLYVTEDRKSTSLNSSHTTVSRMPSSA